MANSNIPHPIEQNIAQVDNPGESLSLLCLQLIAAEVSLSVDLSAERNYPPSTSAVLVEDDLFLHPLNVSVRTPANNSDALRAATEIFTPLMPPDGVLFRVQGNGACLQQLALPRRSSTACLMWLVLV